MNIDTIDFRNEKSEDCVLIDTKAWVQSRSLEMHRLSGRVINTHITKALKENAVKDVLKELVKENDLLLLNRVAAEIASDRAFAIEGDDKRYFQVPIMQVIGSFNEGSLSLDSLNLLLNKVLIKKIDPTYDSFIISPNDNTMVGEVIKLGPACLDSNWERVPYKVQVGDVVLIRDNISTEVFLDGQCYYALEESMIVGKFNKKPYILSEVEAINGSILMSEYMPKNVLNSTLLTPDLVYEDLDFTDLYNRNLFQVVVADCNLTTINKNDILLVLRDLTNYVYFNLEKYFIINGTEFVEAKIE